MLIKNIIWKKPLEHVLLVRKKAKNSVTQTNVAVKWDPKKFGKKIQKDFKAIKIYKKKRSYQMPSHPISCNTIFKVCVNDEVVHAIKVLASVSIRSNLFFPHLLLTFVVFFFIIINVVCFFLFFVAGCWVLPLPFISHCNKPITRTPCALNQNFYFLFHFSYVSRSK